MGKWFGKETVDVPAEYADLTPEQIVAKLKSADAAAAKVTELEGKVTEIDTLKTKIADLEKTPPRREEQQQQRQQENPPNERTSFLIDEDRAFNERAAPLVGYALQIGERVALSDFKSGITDPVERRMYTKYGKEVDELMKNEAPQNRANPAAWDAAWNIIKGRHVMDISKNPNEFFSETASGDPGAGPSRGADPEVLSDKEKALAKSYGISEDEYKAQRKEMVIHHG